MKRVIFWRQIMRPEQVFREEGATHTGRSWQPASDGPLFVSLESRSFADHQQFDRLIGKVVKITVEVEDA